MKAIICALAALAVQANASVLFSDLGTGGSVYSTAPGSIIQGSGLGAWITQARPFTVSGAGNFLLTQFDLGIVNDSPSAATFTASIWTDTSSLPGTELGSWSLSTSTTFGNCCGLVTQSGITGITLTGGLQYWMVVGPQSGADHSKNEWADNTQGLNSARLGSLDGGGSWIVDGAGTAAAFDVLGATPPSPTPEPSTLLLLGAAFLPMLAAKRR